MSKDNDLDAVRVDRSRHGMGVFAIREFKIKEVVGRLTGKLIEDCGYESDYCIEIDLQTALEPDEPFRFINHSCRPNCELACWEDGSTKMWVEVIRDIGPEEELTIDYAWPANSAVACGCGSPDCRGWIVALDQVDDVAYFQGECADG